MKTMIFVLSLLASTSVFAKNKGIEDRIRFAANLLAETAQGSQEYKVTPQADTKKMLLEFALQEGSIESEEDFEANWTTNTYELWGADGMMWGLETAGGAYGYVSNALEVALEEGEQTDKDKITFADGMLKLNRAFQILRSIKSVKYGVAPMGAVQCGVTFPSLLIMDTENGVIHQIIMEGSGC
ncbi:hypothetical protein QJS83_07500 [Bdellovibrio sp. 22V]|uniref:hypothetical protein n=1 Tax=Bdellovibrio sp. 22V TaxID=3044166 RepID=UPI00254304DF|nr:hypothetical protein [Bdellovibrio sp. 22V]WII73719.1 hypothetical protein QJS83_07500 [Bdellovibrio sp. 22V]